jgi:hypothetical protein
LIGCIALINPIWHSNEEDYSRSKSLNATSNASAMSIKFSPISANERCIDNTKKIAVYLPSMTTSIVQQSTMERMNIPITYDPFCTSIFFEYNPDYLNDSDIADKLTTSNYDLLIVPKSEMSNVSAIAINTYLSKGGSVWFLNDPSLLPNESPNSSRINILGKARYSPFNTISNSSMVTINNNDNITNGLPSSFKPIGATKKWYFFRALSGSGTISGFNYNVLMSNGNCAMMIKYENSTTGARAIYSNINMFISGGDCSYFNTSLATKLFLQTKSWLLKMQSNINDIEITYPRSDKQFTITFDDERASSAEGTRMDQMFNMEKAHGLTPLNVNTFFIIPNADTIESKLQFYAANGDTHALHPHDLAIWDNNQSVSVYQNDIQIGKNYINAVANTTDYGFNSFRFPMTAFCTNSMQAVSNSDFRIDSSAGLCTDSTAIGTLEINNVFFPKQVIINNIKSNLIEMEITSGFDIETSDGSTFYQEYEHYIPYFKNVNFPSNFIVGCHYQGAGTVQKYTDGLAQIIDASKNTSTMYNNLSTIANYVAAIKSAQIEASTSGNNTKITIIPTKQITDFTLKVLDASNISATYDGVPISNNDIRRDDNTWYITQTVDTGQHTIVLIRK